MTAPLIEGRGRKGGLLFHHYCLLRNPITIITKARKKCPRRKEPFNKGFPGLWRHGVEGEAQAQKKYAFLFSKELMPSASMKYTCPRPRAHSSDP